MHSCSYFEFSGELVRDESTATFGEDLSGGRIEPMSDSRAITI